jgi:hypothetical protein
MVVQPAVVQTSKTLASPRPTASSSSASAAAALAAAPASDVRTFLPGQQDEEAEALKAALLAGIDKIEKNDPGMVHLNANNSVCVSP